MIEDNRLDLYRSTPSFLHYIEEGLSLSTIKQIFNASSKHEEGWENSRQFCKQETSSRNGFADLSRILPVPRMSRWAYVNTEKVFYCSNKIILNTASKAGESSLISSSLKRNDWQKEKLDTLHEILHRKNNFGELTWWNKCNYHKVDQKNLIFNTPLSGIWITPSLRRVFKNR